MGGGGGGGGSEGCVCRCLSLSRNGTKLAGVEEEQANRLTAKPTSRLGGDVVRCGGLSLRGASRGTPARIPRAVEEEEALADSGLFLSAAAARCGEIDASGLRVVAKQRRCSTSTPMDLDAASWNSKAEARPAVHGLRRTVASACGRLAYNGQTLPVAGLRVRRLEKRARQSSSIIRGHVNILDSGSRRASKGLDWPLLLFRLFEIYLLAVSRHLH